MLSKETLDILANDDEDRLIYQFDDAAELAKRLLDYVEFMAGAAPDSGVDWTTAHAHAKKLAEIIR